MSVSRVISAYNLQAFRSVFTHSTDAIFRIQGHLLPETWHAPVQAFSKVAYTNQVGHAAHLDP